MNIQRILIPLTFLFCFSINAAAQECVDSDGDGWGWDGTKSCRVAEGNTTNTPSNTSSGDCVDTAPIGDGWGWDGSKSCIIDNEESLTHSGSCPDGAYIFPASGDFGSYIKSGYPDKFVDSLGIYGPYSGLPEDFTIRSVHCTTRSQKWLKSNILETFNNNLWIRANNAAEKYKILIKNGDVAEAKRRLYFEQNMINFFNQTDLYSDIGITAWVGQAVGGKELAILWMIEDTSFVEDIRVRYLKIVEAPF